MPKTNETMKGKPTKKERRFTQLYHKTGNGLQSALKSYETTNPNSAGAIASQNLKKLRVQEYLKKMQDELDYSEFIEKRHLVNKSCEVMDNKSSKPMEILKAVETVAVLTGNWKEIHENRNFDETKQISKKDLEKLSKDELVNTVLDAFKLSARGVDVVRKEDESLNPVKNETIDDMGNQAKNED